MKRKHLFVRIFNVMLAGIFLLSITASCSTVTRKTNEEIVKDKKDPKFSLFSSKGFNLYDILESYEGPDKKGELLSINVAKISSDEKYIAVGSTERIQQSALDLDGNDDGTMWLGLGIVTILDYTSGDLLYRLDDGMQFEIIKDQQKRVLARAKTVNNMIDRNEAKSKIDLEISILKSEADRYEYALDADMGIAFLEFTPNNKSIVSAPKKHNTGIDWVVLWSLETGKKQWFYTAGFGGIKSMEFIEEGSKIMIIDTYDRVTIIDADTGRAVK
jgi:WD40 repeat protein